MDGLPSLGRGWGVAPPNALCKFMATPSPGVGGAIEGPGEPSTVDISFTSRRCRGWGVGIFIRGRVVELTIERRKDFRRVCGVSGSSSSAASVELLFLGVANRSAGGVMRLKRALGRGKAGVGVNAKD